MEYISTDNQLINSIKDKIKETHSELNWNKWFKIFSNKKEL